MTSHLVLNLVVTACLLFAAGWHLPRASKLEELLIFRSFVLLVIMLGLFGC